MSKVLECQLLYVICRGKWFKNICSTDLHQVLDLGLVLRKNDGSILPLLELSLRAVYTLGEGFIQFH